MCIYHMLWPLHSSIRARAPINHGLPPGPFQVLPRPRKLQTCGEPVLFFSRSIFFPPPELTFWRESAEVEQERQQRQQDALRRRRRRRGPCPVAPPRPQGGAVILTVAVAVVVAVGGVRRCGIPPPSLFRRRIHPSCIIVWTPIMAFLLLPF